MAMVLVLPPAAVQAAKRSPNPPLAWQAGIDAAVELLRGPRSLWPVDSGRSKRSFERTRNGLSSRIFNEVPYSRPVEALNGYPAANTMKQNIGVIIGAIEGLETISPAERRRRAAEQAREDADIRTFIQTQLNPRQYFLAALRIERLVVISTGERRTQTGYNRSVREAARLLEMPGLELSVEPTREANLARRKISKALRERGLAIQRAGSRIAAQQRPDTKI